MIHLEIHDRTTGFLALLLVLLFGYVLKLGPIHSQSRGLPHHDDLFVQIEGDIQSPGVYSFNRSVNLLELIERAGGLNSHYTSLPEGFKDYTFSSGSRVIVKNDSHGCDFSKNEMSAFYKMTLGIPISLNKESEAGLTAIPWIGMELARTIVEARAKRGGFRNINEIIDIRGIGPRLYTKIKPYVTL